MDYSKEMKAILEIWNELPRLIGHEWVKIYPQIQERIIALSSAQDADAQNRLMVEICELLLTYKELREHVEKKLDTGASRGGFRSLDIDDTDDAKPVAARGDRTAWQAITSLMYRIGKIVETRSPEIRASKQLEPEDEGQISVYLKYKPDKKSGDTAAIAVDAPGELCVSLDARSEGIVITGSRAQRLSIRPHVDSPHIVFEVKAKSLGKKHLDLEFWQNGSLLRTVDVHIDVVERKMSDATKKVSAAPLRFDEPYAPPPDLVLRVALPDETKRTLKFTLDSPAGTFDFFQHDCGSAPIDCDPEEYRKRLFGRLEQLSIDNSPSEAIKDSLDTLGQDLYKRLFSNELREAYRRMRTRKRNDDITTLMIVSDEPWIPWELVKPYDDSKPQEIIDDNFLCVQFELTRWLAGKKPEHKPPAGSIDVPALACVAVSKAAGHSALPSVVDERKFLLKLAGQTSTIPHTPPARRSEVKNLMKSGEPVGLWHFATHGNSHHSYDLVMEAGPSLQAIDLNGPIQTRIAANRPLAFINACRSGEQTFEISGLGGWANAFVRDCRCGAFIAPHWSITDECAGEFSNLFYSYLREGRTLSSAMRSTRLKIMRKYPDDPTWLAYSVYAHPNARVYLGDRAVRNETARYRKEAK